MSRRCGPVLSFCFLGATFTVFIFASYYPFTFWALSTLRILIHYSTITFSALPPPLKSNGYSQILISFEFLVVSWPLWFWSFFSSRLLEKPTPVFLPLLAVTPFWPINVRELQGIVLSPGCLPIILGHHIYFQTFQFQLHVKDSCLCQGLAQWLAGLIQIEFWRQFYKGHMPTWHGWGAVWLSEAVSQPWGKPACEEGSQEEQWNHRQSRILSESPWESWPLHFVVWTNKSPYLKSHLESCFCSEGQKVL